VAVIAHTFIIMRTNKRGLFRQAEKYPVWAAHYQYSLEPGYMSLVLCSIMPLNSA